MKDDATRIEAYNAKTAATTVGLKVASQLAPMKAGFASAAASFVAKEIAIQGVLNADGTIPTIQYPFYLSFGREMWGLNQRGISGTIATPMAISLATKWQSYGLAKVMLQEIADTVFNITIP
jgi:hypothetical protein